LAERLKALVSRFQLDDQAAPGGPAGRSAAGKASVSLRRIA